MKNNMASIGMVKSIKIANFRGFERLEIDDLGLINIFVGDNGVGKTALLESFFLAVSSSPQSSLQLKQWRGMSPAFQAASANSVVDALYGDLFHDADSPEPITISLVGRGFENRNLVISKTAGNVIVPTKGVQVGGNRQQRRAAQKQQTQIADFGQTTVVPITLSWTDEHGTERNGRILISPAGLTLEGTGEAVPACFMFAAQIPVPPEEPARHYSELRKRRETDGFRKAFLSIFDQINDISSETESGTYVLLADVPWAKRMIPLAAISGGTNRTAAILLAIAFRREGLILIDEVESGIYYNRQKKFSKAIVDLSREYSSQIIMTTHSEEWLGNFLSTVTEKNDDIAVWRIERDINLAPMIRRFTCNEFLEGMSLGEMR